MARLLTLVLFFFSLFFQQGTCASTQCKATAGSSNWPTTAQWQSLNTSVSGRLSQPVPPGAPCHSNFPQYDTAACTAVYNQWSTPSFYVNNPVAVDYNDDTCLPSAAAPCSASGYPAYVVTATSASDVQAAVKFAASTKVRLVIKNTGHDFLGRSSGPGALSIYTHNLQGITFNMNDKRTFNGAIGTVTIGSGQTVVDVLNAAAANNVTVITGSDQTVGVAGFLSGGGHGPVTSRYGLGADQVIEMQVVTASGQLLTINTSSSPDLFWAMRGGGPSFGVVISATVLVYPNVATTYIGATYNTTANSDTFWDLATFFHTWIPRLSDAGIMGYYYLYPDTGAGGQVVCDFLVPDKTVAQAQAILAPMEAQMKNSSWPDPVTTSDTGSYYNSYSAFWATVPPATVGHQVRLGSRLLDNTALTANQTALKIALQQAMPPGGELLGHMVAGPGVKNIKIPGGNSVLPAWRSTYAHLIAPVTWDYLDAAGQATETADLKTYTAALKTLAPNTGAYMSEADPTEPQWQQTFWGVNYLPLLAIKIKYDPQGVFWCTPCVGHELWTVTGGDGIGQDNGTICKAL